MANVLFIKTSSLGDVIHNMPALTDARTRPAREIRFVWEDGPHDCESLAVDLPHRRFLMLDKSRHPVGLYELAAPGRADLLG